LEDSKLAYRLRLAQDDDCECVAKIFNHFVKNSFSAYPSLPVDDSFLQRMKALVGKLPLYVAENLGGTVIGFACLRPLHLADTIARSAEATIFILPEHTRHGLGGQMLAKLEEDAKALGVDTIIGGASSHNQASLDFQRKNGFSECGRFQKVGRKFGKDFDIVWMQKFI
jgi:L-amino acid N-acyltransferase YncA